MLNSREDHYCGELWNGVRAAKAFGLTCPPTWIVPANRSRLWTSFLRSFPVSMPRPVPPKPTVKPDGPDRQPWPSRPGEFHPEPPTDPDLNPSIHPAHVTARRLPPSPEPSRSSRFYPVGPPPTTIPPPLRSMRLA